ncbi:Uncharacterised protein [Candidatus Anstonella stagnisolia]|nr:Uncharacterised protein [Candidatus Anstonella stagnisolia]
MPFEYVLAEMLNQNKISGEQEEIGRKDAKVVLKVPANWDAHSQLIARADTLLQRISGQ